MGLRSDGEKTVADAWDLVRSITQALRTLLRDAEHGEDIDLRQFHAKQTLLHKAILDAKAMETQFNEQFNTQLRTESEFDLDAARAEIRCQLGRLRKCCTEGRVSSDA